MGLQQQPPVNAIPPEYTRQKLPEIDPEEAVSDVWWWWWWRRRRRCDECVGGRGGEGGPCTRGVVDSHAPIPPTPTPTTLLQIQGPTLVARRADMDMNGHINNVTYLSWALETVPGAVYDHHHLYQVGRGVGAGGGGGAPSSLLPAAQGARWGGPGLSYQVMGRAWALLPPEPPP